MKDETIGWITIFIIFCLIASCVDSCVNGEQENGTATTQSQKQSSSSANNAKTYKLSRKAFEDSQRKGRITVCGVYKQNSSWGSLILDDSSFFPDEIRLDGISKASWESYDGRYLCVTGRVVDDSLPGQEGNYWMRNPSRDR